MLHRETLSTLVTLIVAVLMALALIALQPQPPAPPRAAAVVGTPLTVVDPICAGAAPASIAMASCAAAGSKS